MRLLLTISLALWLGAAQAESIRILVQNSPLAGSQYYAVGEQWQAMQVGVAARGGAEGALGGAGSQRQARGLHQLLDGAEAVAALDAARTTTDASALDPSSGPPLEPAYASMTALLFTAFGSSDSLATRPRSGRCGVASPRPCGGKSRNANGEAA